MRRKTSMVSIPSAMGAWSPSLEVTPAGSCLNTARHGEVCVQVLSVHASMEELKPENQSLEQWTQGSWKWWVHMKLSGYPSSNTSEKQEERLKLSYTLKTSNFVLTTIKSYKSWWGWGDQSLESNTGQIRIDFILDYQTFCNFLLRAMTAKKSCLQPRSFCRLVSHDMQSLSHTLLWVPGAFSAMLCWIHEPK